jgi:hypothetical protein
MQLATATPRAPQLILALEALAQRPEHDKAAHELLHELSGITVLVARKFTNDKTADGLLEAFYLTIGCISLAIAQANTSDTLSFLLKHGAEYVFQMGFRLIKELSSLPYVAFVSDHDRNPLEQQLNIKTLFSEICRADPGDVWIGDDAYNKYLIIRRSIQKEIECAKWLRMHNFRGPVKDPELLAEGVINIAVIFAIQGDGRIVARCGNKGLEEFIRSVRATQPDIEANWNDFLQKIPLEYQPILRERMDVNRKTIIKKILSKASLKTVITEIDKEYAGGELDIDYP